MFKHKKIAFCITGAYSTFKYIIPEIKKMIEMEAEVFPIMSFNSYELDTRYGEAKDYIEQIEIITNNKVIHTILDAELIGSKCPMDILVIIPCTGNTIRKTYKWNFRHSCFSCC